MPRNDLTELLSTETDYEQCAGSRKTITVTPDTPYLTPMGNSRALCGICDCEVRALPYLNSPAHYIVPAHKKREPQARLL